MLNTSSCYHYFKLELIKPNGEPYVFYGDPAYGLTQNILASFKGTKITANEQKFNRDE